MRLTDNIRYLLVATAGMLASITVEAQTVEKPKVQTSARPEQTTVFVGKGGGVKASATAKNENVKAEKRDDRKAAKAPEKKASPKAEAKRTKAAKPDAGNGTRRYMALKTNVPFDAIGVLNLGYEVQVHRRMTLDIPLTWSFWDAEREHALRTVALQPELRWWTGSEAGRGHFFGLHAHVAWFNLKWDEDRYQDAGRPLLGAGLSYGYKLPLGEHWGAEFGLGLGYANMKYDTYYNIENGARLDTRVRHYWGLTRIAAALAYRF